MRTSDANGIVQIAITGAASAIPDVVATMTASSAPAAEVVTQPTKNQHIAGPSVLSADPLDGDS